MESNHMASAILFGNRSASQKPVTTGERIGNPNSPRICRIDKPVVFTATAQDSIGDAVNDPSSVEILIGHGESTVSQAEADISAQRDLVEQIKAYTARTQTALAKEEAHAVAVDPAVKQQIQMQRGKAATAAFMAQHKDWFVSTYNQKLLEDEIFKITGGNIEEWTLATMELSYQKVEPLLVTADGRTRQQVRTDAEQEARLRPRHADAPSPVAPAPNPQSDAANQRAIDIQTIREFEALPMGTQRRHIKGSQRIALAYNAALTRLNAR